MFPLVARRSYIIQFGLCAGEGERESNRKSLIFDVVLLHEVPQTFCHVVKKLWGGQTERLLQTLHSQTATGLGHLGGERLGRGVAKS